MARGWESKSVEEQMATVANNSLGSANEAVRRQALLRNADRERQRQALRMQRENILSQRTSSPARRQALEAALAEIEAQIQALD
jgi:hypothetical protein